MSSAVTPLAPKIRLPNPNNGTIKHMFGADYEVEADGTTKRFPHTDEKLVPVAPPSEVYRPTDIYNCYVSLVEAEDYYATRLHKAEWDSATAEEKKQALIWSSREIDHAFFWKGSRWRQNQSMNWPRLGMYDRDGWYVHEEEIPYQLKVAVIEYAIELIKENRVLKGPEPDSIGVHSISISGIGIGINPNDRKRRIPNHIRVYLSAFIESETEGFRSLPIVKRG